MIKNYWIYGTEYTMATCAAVATTAGDTEHQDALRVANSRGGQSPAEIEAAGETNVKKNYEAKAILRDEAHTWEVMIYSLYETIDEALLGAVRFLGHGYDVEAIYVNERNGTPVRVY